MKIAVLSNVTVDFVTDQLKKEFEVYSPDGYDTWQMEAADPMSGLYKCSPEAVFIILYADKFEEGFQTEELAAIRMDSWLCSVKQLSEALRPVPVFLSSLDMDRICCAPASSICGCDALAADWERQASAGGAYILPVKEAVRNIGREQFYSRKMWYMGNSPYSLKGAKAVAELIRQCCGYLSKPRKKCLVVDLDNTLWGGVIGEEGVNSIELSAHKEGARYYDAQKCLKRMKENGVMLAIASKNNLEDVKPVFHHPYMLLQEDDFVSLKVNWEAKAKNVRDMADELNIGLDAFVFFDDNPAEREQMKSMCPDVSVVDFPKDTSMLPFVIEDIYETYFKALYVTDEDREKTESYRQSQKRKELQSRSSSAQDYLRNLQIIADIHRMRSDELARVVQLAGKTNQFNTTTIRYSEKEILELSQGNDSDVITAYMEDRFGKEGLTAAMVVRYNGERASIDSFLMSCRVMGRKFEHAIMDAFLSWLKTSRPQVKYIYAEYIKTAKNKPVENLYDSFGFSCERQTGKPQEAGYRKYYGMQVEQWPSANAFAEKFASVPYKKITGIGEQEC